MRDPLTQIQRNIYNFILIERLEQRLITLGKLCNKFGITNKAMLDNLERLSKKGRIFFGTRLRCKIIDMILCPYPQDVPAKYESYIADHRGLCRVTDLVYIREEDLRFLSPSSLSN